jgi:predicted alpha/beta superfamily hydrolase
MKPLLVILFLFLFNIVDAQDIKGDQIVAGHIDSLPSKILGEKRALWIHLPAGATDTGNTMKYPVVYLLDGADNFSAVTGLITYLSEKNGNMFCPDMIVVGIPNTDRTRDLTPTSSAVDYEEKPSDMFKTSGGGEKFTAFIQTEVMPYINAKYPAAPFRMLIGHSFGGLTAVNILINHTDMFNAYTIIDPSMWWNGRKLLKQAHEVLKQKSFAGKSVFLSIANTMSAGMDTARVRTDTNIANNHIRSILSLKDEFRNNPNNGLTWTYRYYNDDDHNSSPLIAEYDALRFLFSYYHLPADEASKLYETKAKIKVGDLITAHYADISKHMGYKVLPPESVLNEMGYNFMEIKTPDRAFDVFSLNIKYYPASNGVYDSMGDYYAYQKDKAHAVEYYNKSLKIKETPDTRAKLNKVLVQK